MANPDILIADSQILKIPIKENGEPMAPLTSAGIMIDRRKKLPESCYRARRSVIVKLIEAERHLPTGIKLLVIETFRPLYIQTQYFKEYSSELKNLHPKWSDKEIRSAASKYVAPPEIIPPHCTGGAVDLTLRDERNKELDMGTALNADPEESDNACFTVTENISDVAKRNRKLLIDAMSAAGFVNYPTEWWHWSFGDRYWAYKTKTSNAIYGAANDLDVALLS